MTKLTYAEAELAKWKPLIEAVEKAPVEDLESCIAIYGQDLNPDPALDIIRAALACREEKK